MIRICFVTQQMVLGGVERTLLALFDALKEQDVEIDLYVQKAGGELFNDIPSWINVYVLQTCSAFDSIRHPFHVAQKTIAYCRLKHEHSYAEQCYLTSRMLLPVQICKPYDIAISYHAPNTVPVFFTMDKVPAKRKILWLHGTLEENSGLEPICKRYHERYDRIICVSKTVYNSVLSFYPGRKANVILRYNMIDEDRLRSLADKGRSFRNKKTFTILTIARLSRQKGIDLAIEACAELISEGYSFRWYVCGEGEERSSLEELIKEKQLDKVLTFLGNQKNPYGYLSTCDLYVQTSRYEGYCTATNEARILNKPVITTEVSGAREQFEDSQTGWIVPISAKEIANRIGWCMDHPQVLKTVRKRLQEIGEKQNRQASFLWDDL